MALQFNAWTDGGAGFYEKRFTVRDGLALYARRYRAHTASRLRPVLCLAGLTRNSRDFHVLAAALSGDEAQARDVYTLDTRGRGLSDHDSDWRNYAVPVEMLDALDFLTAEDLSDVALVGTSRGGLIAMVMGAAQPSAIGCVVLNDIGPVLEADGLLRIAGYVGRTPVPATWDDAARIVRQINERQFPKVTDAQWMVFARQIFNEKDGRPVPSYDPRVARSLAALEGPVPALWPQFQSLKRVPVLAIRGANSDLLSAATVEEMARRHPVFSTHVVPDEGHAPLLHDAATIAAISQFLAHADATASHVAPA